MLAEDPEIGTRDPRHRAPVYRFTVPSVRLAITYLVAEQFHTIRVISVDPMD